MKAAVCYEFGKPLVVEELEIADPLKGELKVRVAATAICHSDIHDMKGELPGPLPFVGGHETAGYVDKVGPGVTSVKEGDPVVVSLLSSCGHCYFCLVGLPHLCENKFGPSPNVKLRNSRGQEIIQKAGVAGFAEYVVVKESQVVKIPADMPIDRAALLACGVITGFGGVVNRAKVRPMQSVVVVGTGGVGINAIQGAAFSGAYPIIAVDVLDSKLKAAKSFGATHGVNAKNEAAVEEVKKIANGRGADFVFVTVGSVAAMRQGFAMSGPRGTTVIIGLPQMKDMLMLSPFEFIVPEKTLTGGFMGSANLKIDIPNLVTLYKRGILKLDELITGHYPLAKINEAIESSEKGEVIRNVIMF
ncbi:MAG TPA: Zn-dependent alcohol dehydrogenase [Dehalococcoidales bacterium]